MTVRVPKYRHHHGSGQALVEIDGRRIYLGKYNSAESREKYRRLVAQVLSPPIDAPAAAIAAPRPLTINRLILQYFQFAKTYYVKNGRLTDEIASLRAALRRLRTLYGRTPVLEFGPRAFKQVREAMIQQKLSRKYVNDSMARIRRMFRWAVAEELVPPSVYQALAAVPGLRRGRSGARESQPVLPVSDETVALTLPFLPEVVGDMVRLQELAGMRPQDVCAVRPCDLDRSGDVWIYRPASHKCEHLGKEHVVLLGPKAQAVLLRYLARDGATHCFQPRDSERKRRAAQHAARKTPLNCGNRPGGRRAVKPVRAPGECYTVDSYRRAIHRACDKAFKHPILDDIAPQNRSAAEKAELQQWRREHRWSPNRLRHAAATKVRREFGLEAAQIVLGHSAADVTQIYAERDLAKGLDVARMIG